MQLQIKLNRITPGSPQVQTLVRTGNRTPLLMHSGFLLYLSIICLAIGRRGICAHCFDL